MKDYYTVDIAGRTQQLPLIELPSGIKIAFLNLHGNPKLTEFCGKKIAQMLQRHNIEVLLTAETKGLQLTHVASRELGHDFYCVARKSLKLHMGNYICTEVKAITGETSYTLYLSDEDKNRLSGKRVAILDDVISSGGSLKGLTDLVVKSGGILITSACVLAEGDSISSDVLRLGNLPLF